MFASLQNIPPHISLGSSHAHSPIVVGRAIAHCCAIDGTHTPHNEHDPPSLHTPCLNWQVATSQQVQLTRSPQSHCSPNSTIPLPHTAVLSSPSPRDSGREVGRLLGATVGVRVIAFQSYSLAKFCVICITCLPSAFVANANPHVEKRNSAWRIARHRLPCVKSLRSSTSRPSSHISCRHVSIIFTAVAYESTAFAQHVVCALYLPVIGAQAASNESSVLPHSPRVNWVNAISA